MFMTQLESAVTGIITKEMTIVAENNQFLKIGKCCKEFNIWCI